MANATVAPKRALSISVVDANPKGIIYPKGIPGATVTITDATGATVGNGVTADDGKWDTSKPSNKLVLAVGSYSVVVAHMGYGPVPTPGVAPVQGSVTQSVDVTKGAGAQRVTVSLGQALACALITVVDGATKDAIRGARVLVQSGNTLPPAAPAAGGTSAPASTPAGAASSSTPSPPAAGAAGTGSTPPPAAPGPTWPVLWPGTDVPSGPPPERVAEPIPLGDDSSRTDTAGVCIAWLQPLPPSTPAGSVPAPPPSSPAPSGPGSAASSGQGTPLGAVAGTQWTVYTQKPGYGPNDSKSGDVGVLLTFPPGVTSVPLTIALVNAWGSIGSGQGSVGTIGGVDFITWYNLFLKDYTRDTSVPDIGVFPWVDPVKNVGPYGCDYVLKPVTNKAGFSKMFSAASVWWKNALSIEEFLGMFLIILNECGFKQTSEIPQGIPAGTTSDDVRLHYSLKYFFMYNRHYNKLAGEHLADLKSKAVQASGNWSTVLANFTSDDKDKWNGTVYPVVDPVDGVCDPVEKAAKECDFFKYRGHGYHQLTWRGNHAIYAAPAINPSLSPKDAAGLKSFLDETTTDAYEAYWTDEMAMRELKAWNFKYASYLGSFNDQQWFEFAWHQAGSKAYGAAVQWRARVLLAGLKAAEAAGKGVSFA